MTAQSSAQGGGRGRQRRTGVGTEGRKRKQAEPGGQSSSRQSRQSTPAVIGGPTRTFTTPSLVQQLLPPSGPRAVTPHAVTPRAVTPRAVTPHAVTPDCTETDAASLSVTFPSQNNSSSLHGDESASGGDLIILIIFILCFHCHFLGRIIPGTCVTYQEAVVLHTRDYLVTKGISVHEIVNADLVRSIRVRREHGIYHNKLLDSF